MKKSNMRFLISNFHPYYIEITHGLAGDESTIARKMKIVAVWEDKQLYKAAL